MRNITNKYMLEKEYKEIQKNVVQRRRKNMYRRK